VETRYIVVDGMTCDHCANAVQGELLKLAGVTGIDVDVSAGRVKITATQLPGDAEMRAAVEEAGYTLTGLQHQDQHVSHGDAHGYLAERRAAGGQVGTADVTAARTAIPCWHSPSWHSSQCRGGESGEPVADPDHVADHEHSQDHGEDREARPGPGHGHPGRRGPR
jgi:copper chaperone CopZ